MLSKDPIRFILEFAKIIERIICGVKCYLLFTVEASECRTKLLHVKKSVTNLIENRLLFSFSGKLKRRRRWLCCVHVNQNSWSLHDYDVAFANANISRPDSEQQLRKVQKTRIHFISDVFVSVMLCYKLTYKWVNHRVCPAQLYFHSQ